MNAFNLFVCVFLSVLVTNKSFAFDDLLETTSITFPPKLLAGKTDDHTIELSFRGKIYDEKYSFNYIEKKIKASKASDFEEFIYKVIKTNKGIDKDAILDLWEKDSRDRIEKMMKDPETFRKNHAFFKNINSSKMMAVILYKNYVLFYVDHDLQGIGSFIKVYPAIIEDSKMLLTNKLRDEYFFSYIADNLGKYIKDYYQ